MPRPAVDAAVEDAFGRWDVVGFYADLREFEAYVDEWHRRHGDTLCVGRATNKVAWDMRAGKASTDMIEAFYSAILEGEARHSGHQTLAQHVYNCRRRPAYGGITVGKPDAQHKIDAAVAAGLAWQCCRDYLALPASKQRRPAAAPQIFVV